MPASLASRTGRNGCFLQSKCSFIIKYIGNGNHILELCSGAAASRPQRLLDFARRLAAGVLPVDFLRHSDAQYTRPARFLVAIMKAGSGSWQQHARVVLSELQPADGDSEALGTAWVRCYAEPAAATGDRKSMTHGALGTGPCYVNSCYLRVSFISAF